ncbi:GntR family transcriptional regulator [Saccharothrix saharensis]|uniref:GntR family transcriptional regulator n=1 Tax=Saccharothrix saharensis TaxID=571190 RepID=A0A543J6F2_9PSEU|nr:GntR family transcriptional regulator [Saccharothrix saharensis]TQM78416.1 GntR family transcriptional regulator [Saccharothrix saharensis]
MNDGRRTGREYESRVPKYLAIYRVLADRITTGRYPADTPLPAQRELADEFAVSLMTVRQAIQALEADGLLETRHGVGTFVRQPAFAYDLTGLRSLSQDLIEQGIELETEVLDAQVVVPPEDVSARLGVGADGRALAVKRLRSTRSVPLLLQTSYLPEAIGARIDPDDLRRRSLYLLLQDMGQPVREASETIRAVALSAAQARALKREPGSPALLSIRLSRSEDGTPLVDDRALLVGDTVITAERAVTGTNFAYEHH